jgi:hypothetical protein
MARASVSRSRSASRCNGYGDEFVRYLDAPRWWRGPTSRPTGSRVSGASFSSPSRPAKIRTNPRQHGSVIFEFPGHPRLRRALQLAVYRTFTPSSLRPNCTSTFDAPVPKVVQAIDPNARAALGHYLEDAHPAPIGQHRYYATVVAYGVVSMQGSVLRALWWRAAHQPKPA